MLLNLGTDSAMSTLEELSQKWPPSRLPSFDQLVEGASYSNWHGLGLLGRLQDTRPPPLLHQEFAHVLQSTKAFTNGADAQTVCELYKKLSTIVLDGGKEFVFMALGWGSEEAIKLSKVLPCCAQMEALSLSRNPLGKAGAIALADTLATSHTLTSVDVENTNLFDDGVAVVLDALARNTKAKIQWLYISRNHLSIDGARHVAKYMAADTHLKLLSVWDNPGLGEGMAEIARAFLHNKKTNIEMLYIGGNRPGVEASRALVDLVVEGCPKLTVLNMCVRSPGGLWVTSADTCDLEADARSQLMTAAARRPEAWGYPELAVNLDGDC